MITKASQLLDLFIKEESLKLEGFEMPHMPTLGSAYEEITKQGIDNNFTIPKHLELSVVSGFISIAGEMLPEQVDCMLVHGNGTKYGLTNQYIYPIEQVLCIFEVKKTLRKKDYSDAFDHLGNIRKKYAEHFENKLEFEDYKPDISLARKYYSQITGEIAPQEYPDIHNLSKSNGMIFYSLVQETLAPVSIIHGYHGYKTENGLRTAFLDILEEKSEAGGAGLGVPNLPTLVTSNQFCLVKGNGLPFLGIKDKNSWVVISSTRYNSAKMILELIWSKISFYFNISMPWNDGLEIENLQPLLVALPKETSSSAGWLYQSIELGEKNLKRENTNSWEPSSLGKAELSLVNIMAMKGGYLPIDDGIKEYLESNYGTTIENVSENLILSREFMKDGEYIRPINSLTHIITNDDKTGYVSSNKDCFDLWCNENDIEPNYMNIMFLEE